MENPISILMTLLLSLSTVVGVPEGHPGLLHRVYWADSFAAVVSEGLPGPIYRVELPASNPAGSGDWLAQRLPGLGLPGVMLDVVRCESGRNRRLIAGDGKHGPDYGLFQINWYWWGDDLQRWGIAQEPLDLLNVDTNLRATRLVYRTMGLKAWEPSEHCWGRQ